MKFKTIIGLLIVLILCTCAQRKSKDSFLTDSGLLIKSGANQGLTHIDSQGIKYSYRYFTTTITNDSTISINLKIALSNEYKYPVPYEDKKYKVFLLPKELTPNPPALYNKITDGLDTFLNRILDTPYNLNRILEPNESLTVTIGTLYDNPTNCGIVPKVLFTLNESNNFQACDFLMNQDKPTNPNLAFGVKLDYCNSGCVLIPFGKVSFLKH